MKQSSTQRGIRTLANYCRRMGFFMIALVLTALTSTAFAQGGGNVTGVVKDNSGSPVIGVAVTIPNTARGTSTDIDGRYTIKASAKESLNFSYIGYKNQLVPINGRTQIDITLQEDNTSLEEVVVVGYGVQKKRDIVGAVEQITSKDIENRIGSYQNAARSLQGSIPGLTVTFSDGKPTRGASIRIRGVENSIGSGGAALVLVDGVEADISTVNSEDIESYTVLKDASSTAVYGSRGTFGVILITTKKPEKGQMKITYNGSYNFYQRSVTPEIVDNGLDWTNSFLESYINGRATDPANINNVFRFNRTWYEELNRRNADPSYEKWRVNPSDGRYEYFGNTNWYDIFYKDYTTGHQHNLSITGGSDKASYYVSGRFFHQDGIYKRRRRALQPVQCLRQGYGEDQQMAFGREQHFVHEPFLAPADHHHRRTVVHHHPRAYDEPPRISDDAREESRRNVDRCSRLHGLGRLRRGPYMARGR